MSLERKRSTGPGCRLVSLNEHFLKCEINIPRLELPNFLPRVTIYKENVYIEEGDGKMMMLTTTTPECLVTAQIIIMRR